MSQRRALPRLLDLLAPPTDTPGRRRSYHRLILASSAVLLPVVLFAPASVAVPVAVAVLLVWYVSA